MLSSSMDNRRTIPVRPSEGNESIPLREKSNPMQTLGKSVPNEEPTEPPCPSSSGVRSTESAVRVKKVKKTSKRGKGTRERRKEPFPKESSRKGSLKEGVSGKRGFQTRKDVGVPKKSERESRKTLTESVWDEDDDEKSSLPENTNPSQTLRLKSRTCKYIVTHRGKSRLCWRECYKNHNVCIRHFPRQQCSFKEERDGEWYCCERKTKTEFCTYHSKSNRDQCKGFTIDSDMRKRCTMKRVRGSNFCKKHVDQPPDATLCGAPKGKTVCKVVTSRGSYCREHSSLPGRSTNYGSDRRVDALDNRLWSLFKQYKESGNQKYLGVMVKHKESRVKLE